MANIEGSTCVPSGRKLQSQEKVHIKLSPSNTHVLPDHSMLSFAFCGLFGFKKKKGLQHSYIVKVCNVIPPCIFISSIDIGNGT